MAKAEISFTVLFQDAIPGAKDKRYLYSDYNDYHERLMAEAPNKRDIGLNR